MSKTMMTTLFSKHERLSPDAATKRATYEEAWLRIEPLLEEYIEIPKPKTWHDACVLWALMVGIRDAMLADLGWTFEELDLENERRVLAKFGPDSAAL